MIKELQESFRDILYLDSKHQYFYKNQELKSVTKFLSELKPKFNSSYWSIYKAYQFSGFKVKSIWNDYTKFILFLDPESAHGEFVYLENDHSHLKVTPEDVLIQWSLDSVIGTTRGTYIHDYLDRLEARVIDDPKIEIPQGLSLGQSINYVNSLSLARNLCKEYLEYVNTNLVLIVSEFVIGDPKLGLAGRFDRLYFNKLTNAYEIWDFKTDKQIRYKSSFGKLDIFNLPDCEFEKYSLQTSLYKKIIEDALGVQLGESKVVWFNLKDNKFEIIPTANYVKLITTSLDENNRYSY